MVRVIVPDMAGAELQPGASSHALLFLDLAGSLYTRYRVPKLGQQDELGCWSHKQV